MTAIIFAKQKNSGNPL